MSQVVKCSRLIPQACSLVTRCNSSLANAESAHKYDNKDYKFKFGTGAAAGVGAAWIFTINASAKSADEEMTDLIEDSLEEEIHVPTDSNSRIEKWANVQERYLLLSEAKRAEIELRDVTSQELENCDYLYDVGRFTDLEDLLITLNTVCPHNDEVLWRLARLKWVYGKGYQTCHQHSVFHVAHGLATQAIEINPENGDAHRWVAILGFYRAEKEGVVSGVLNMEAMKYHLDRAIEINPEDNVAWNLLGNWYFELADMTRFQRLWSKVFARVTPPEGSYQIALECFNISGSIKPWIQNTYQIAKTHLRLRDKEKALEMFAKILNSTIVSGEDFRMMKESHIYIGKLTKPEYRDRVMMLLFDGYLEGFRIPFVQNDTKTTYSEETVINGIRGKLGKPYKDYSFADKNNPLPAK